jgi:hypothetical protein
MRKSILGIAFGLFCLSSKAATFTVTTTADAGAGSLRQAILDANALTGADNIVFNIATGAQTITLSSAVNITSAIDIDGTTQPGFSGTPLITIGGANMFQLNGANGAMVKYLAFVSNSGANGIYANSVSNCLFSNNIMTGMSSGIRFDNTCSNNTITANDVSGSGNGIYFVSGNNAGCTINNNNMSNCTGWGLYYNYGTPSSVNSNTFTGCANAWWQGSATNFTISAPGSGGPNANTYGNHTGNVLYINGGTGINISNWDFSALVTAPSTSRQPLLINGIQNSLINNNILTAMLSGIRLENTCSNNTITANDVSGSGNGIYFVSGNNAGCTINNNNMSNCTGWGLYYNYGTPSSVNSNTFTGCANAWWQGSATNFTISAPGSGGPNANTYGNHIGSVLYINGGTGINISNWDFSALVTAPSTSRQPLLINGIQNSLINNNILTAMQSGIRFEGSCSNNTITANDVSGSGNGIYFVSGNNAGCTINNNNMSNCTGWGLFYNYGTPASVNSNTFTGCANAWWQGSATNFTISAPGSGGPNANTYGNHIGSVLYINGGTGINISNWDFSALVTAPSTSRQPLLINGIQNSLINNNILTAMQSGIRFEGSCSNNTITANDVSGSGNGIYFVNGNNAGCMINNNNMSNCTGWGLFYNYGTPASVNSNTFTGCANAWWQGSATNFTISAPGSGGPNANTYGNHIGSVLYINGGTGINISNWDFSALVTAPSTSRQPLLINGIQNSLINNNILTAMQSGIRFEGSCSNNTITANDVSGSGNGIYFVNGNNAGCTINNNNMSNCTGWGLFYNYGTPASVNSNTFTGCTNGIYLNALNTFTLGNSNIFKNHTGTSIQLDGSSAVNISNLSLNGTGGHGVLINNSSNCLFNGNTTCGRTFGIRIQGSSNGNIITNGSIVSCGTGIQLDASTVNNTTITAVNLFNTTNINNNGINSVITGTTNTNSSPIISVNSGSICAGQSFTINPSGASTYTFTDGSAVVTPTINSSYTVTGTDANGCVSATSAVSSVTLNSLPTVSVNSGTICAGQSFTMIPSGAATYTYSNGSSVATPTANSTYSVSGTDANGCVSSIDALASVTVNALPTISVNSGTICAGQSFTMVPSGAVTYTYSNGSDVVSPSTDATYTVTGTDANGCENTAVSSLTVNALPILTVNSGVICAGSTFTIVPSGADTYSYSNGSSVVMPTVNSTYSVTGTNTLTGCSNIAIATVTANALPTISVVTNNTLLCVGQTATLTASGASTYTWNTTENTTAIVVTPSVQTTYTLEGTGANGCLNSTTITQNVSACTGVESLTNDAIINVYPNPNNGLFVVELTSASKVTVVNALGQVVIAETFEAGKHTLNINNESTGVYFVKVMTNNKQQIIKVIKE